MDTIIGGKKMSQQLLIQNGNTVYEPVVQDEITWTTERKGAAGNCGNPSPGSAGFCGNGI